jgi:hypothetical protein
MSSRFLGRGHERRARVFVAVPCLLALLACLGPPARAQDSGTPEGKKPTVEELEKKLDDRDAVIRELLVRVVRLEQRMAVIEAPAAARAARPRPAPAKPSVEPLAPETATAPVSAPAPPAPNAPGQFQVDPEAAQHALERALVETGALLLPPGTAQIVPSFTYQRSGASAPGQLVLTTNNQVLITNQLAQQDQLEAAVLLRAGLPWNAQVDLNLPYDFTHTTDTTAVSGVGLAAATAQSWFLAEPSITFDKLLFEEGSWRPNLVASLGWQSNIGKSKGSIAVGDGFNRLTASLNASKRQDPLVFTASLGYNHAFADGGVDLGDQYTLAMNVLLAVSPETSLSFGPQLTFENRSEVDGTSVPGTEGTSGIFQAGLFTNLAPGVALDLLMGIGAGDKAPDYIFKLALPIQFDL